MATAKSWKPIKRIRGGKGRNAYFKFVLRNGETISFPIDSCLPCLYFKKPKSCRKHICKNFVDEEPFFRMGLSVEHRFRNCTVNPKIKIKIPKWQPYWWRDKPTVRLGKDALVLWNQLKKYAGMETKEGYLQITGYIPDATLFRKALKFGIITKDPGGRWVFVQPEPDAKKIVEKTKSETSKTRKNEKKPKDSNQKKGKKKKTKGKQFKL